MRHNLYLILAAWVLTCGHSDAFAHTMADAHVPHNNKHGTHNAHGGDEHDDQTHEQHIEGGVTEIGAAMARQVGITVKEAGPGTINRTLTAYGKVVTPPGQESHVRARFPGQIKQVYAQVGDTVRAGDLLAEIESNDSLRTYEIKVPIDGVVTQRHANRGEFVQDQNLFSITDFDPLWVELNIFPGQRLDVSQGQAVMLSAGEVEQGGTLFSVVPSREGKPYVIARVELDNANGRWTPGLFVQGDIAVGIVDAPLVVEARALQSHDGARVVFVRKDNRYAARPVKLGRSDGRYVEVLQGIEPGDQYVVDGSYLIKADIEKAGAVHSH